MEVAREAWESLIRTIRARREELGETAASIARKCGMARSYYSQIERGEILNPRLETADRVLRALGLDLTLGATRKSARPNSLTYESPFIVGAKGEARDKEEPKSAIALLREALTDDSIPLPQRQILERQVAALVRVVRQSAQLGETRGGP